MAMENILLQNQYFCRDEHIHKTFHRTIINNNQYSNVGKQIGKEAHNTRYKWNEVRCTVTTVSTH